MEKILGILGLCFALVFVGAVVLTTYQSGQRDAKKNIAMFDVAPETVDRLRVEGPDGETLLVRAGDGWTLPALGGFPADGPKVEDALTRLLRAKATLPAGSGEADLIRFKLVGDDFERRITFASGDRILTTLYLGTPLGPRQVHARRADDAIAYDIDFGLYDAPAESAEWIDRHALAVAPADMAAIEVAGLRLVAEARAAGVPPSWQLDGNGEARLQTTAAARLSALLAQLTVEAMLDQTPEAGDGTTPLLTLTVIRRDDAHVDYRLDKEAAAEAYSLTVSTWPQHFRLTARDARRLEEAARRETLLKSTGSGQHAAHGTDKATQHN